MKPRLFKYQEDLIYNQIALAGLLCAYANGWYLFFFDNWLQNGIGILLLAESMVLAAFFIHEFAHGNIFKSGLWNRYAGKLFMWLSFHGFFAFERIQQLHIAHHRNHADVLHFDFHVYLGQHPIQKKILMGLEWSYVPAVELIIKWHSLLRIWQAKLPAERQLIVLALLVYISLFVLLAWLQPRALFCLALAYILLLHVLRFMDMHQHSYVAYTLDEQGNIPVLPIRDKAYEQANTYSNPLSSRYPWLNWLTLNFGYHNAHHAKPFTPWCRLPQLHKTLNCEKQELPISALLANYHRFRVQRVIHSQIGIPDLNAPPQLRAANFLGVIGASFLNA